MVIIAARLMKFLRQSKQTNKKQKARTGDVDQVFKRPTTTFINFEKHQTETCIPNFILLAWKFFLKTCVLGCPLRSGDVSLRQ